MTELALLPDPLLTVRNGVAVADSRIIAKVANKQHKNAMRDIRNYIAMNPERALNFELTFDEVKGPNGAVRKSSFYWVTEQGCMVLVLGFTGKEAADARWKFTDAFQRMRSLLDSQRDLFAARMRDWELRERESAYRGTLGSKALHVRKREKPVLASEEHMILSEVQLALKFTQ